MGCCDVQVRCELIRKLLRLHHQTAATHLHNSDALSSIAMAALLLLGVVMVTELVPLVLLVLLLLVLLLLVVVLLVLLLVRQRVVLMLLLLVSRWMERAASATEPGQVEEEEEHTATRVDLKHLSQVKGVGRSAAQQHVVCMHAEARCSEQVA